MSQTTWEAVKISKIESYLFEEGESNLWRVRQLALSRGGLINASFRQRLWSKLVGLENEKQLEISNFPLQRQDLIRRDAGRSVIFQYKNSQMVADKSKTKESLISVLNFSVSNNNNVHYFQGLHDIAGAIMYSLDFDVNKSATILKQVCQSHLKDATQEDFSQVQWLLETLFLPLVEATGDNEVYDVLMALSDEAIPVTNIVLPWLITWLTHDVRNECVASRLIDAFLASHPLFPMYFIAALMVHGKLRNIILQAADVDLLSVQGAIQSLPSLLRSDFAGLQDVSRNSTEVAAQDVINVTISLMRKVPPSSLLQLVETKRRTNVEPFAQSVSLLHVPFSWAINGACEKQEEQCDGCWELTEKQRAGPISVQAQIACGVQRSVHDDFSLEWRVMTAKSVCRRRNCYKCNFPMINQTLCFFITVLMHFLLLSQDSLTAMFVFAGCSMMKLYLTLLMGTKEVWRSIKTDHIARLIDRKSLEWFRECLRGCACVMLWNTVFQYEPS